MNPLYITDKAADAIRQHGAGTTIEHGGVVLVDPEHGDILIYVPAPDDIERTAVSVRIWGAGLDAAVRAALAENPGTILGGYVHFHVGGPDTLSMGDHGQLARLHGDPRLPSFGIVTVLGVKRPRAAVHLRVWIARTPDVVEEMQLLEVADARAARALERPRKWAASAKAHVLSTEGGERRLTAELRDLEARGCVVAEMDLVEHGVRLTVSSEEHDGVLVVTIPVEGWERPPRVEIAEGDDRRRLLGAELGSFLAGWSTAYTLCDIVEQAERASLWRGPPPTERSRSDAKPRAALLDALEAELAFHRGLVYGTKSEGSQGSFVLLASSAPSPGLVPVAATTEHASLPTLVAKDGAWHLKLQGRHEVQVEVLRWSTDYSARLAGIVSALGLRGRCVVVVGAGSLGLAIASPFVKAGVGHMVLVDDDQVALENLVRTGYGPEHIGLLKVEAAAEVLARMNPRVRIEPVAKTLHHALADSPELFERADLIVNAASNAAGFELTARFHQRVPILFPGLHAGARSGELFVSGGAAHAERPCFACYRSKVARPTNTGRSWNYQSSDGELKAEPGLEADIRILASMAVSVGLRLLSGTDDAVVDFHRPLLFVNNRKDALLSELFETMWVTVSTEPSCPNHGGEEHRAPGEHEELTVSLPEASP